MEPHSGAGGQPKQRLTVKKERLTLGLAEHTGANQYYSQQQQAAKASDENLKHPV